MSPDFCILGVGRYVNIINMVFCPECPKQDQNLKFTPLRETMSIPCFIREYPPDHYTQCINNILEDCSFLTFFYKIHLSKDSLHFERTWEMSEKTLPVPHQLLCNMYWLNHLDGISLHLQCPKVEASQPNKTKRIKEAHTV